MTAASWGQSLSMPEFPAIIPTVTSGDDRRRFPWKEGSRSKRVPLWPDSDKGEEIEGKIDVPLRLCLTPEHSNERHEFDKLIRENILRWVEWRRQRGWTICSQPKVRGPFDPPTSGNAKAKQFVAQAEKHLGKGREIRVVVPEEDEIKWYMVRARFKREEPVYVRLSDYDYLDHLAEVYAQDDVKDTGWGDPLVIAEERRQRLGLKRKDYLFEDLRIPY